MGVDVSGGMYVGAWKSDFSEDDIDGAGFDEDWDWIDILGEQGINSIAPWYDAHSDDCFFGILVPDTPLDLASVMVWTEKVKKAKEQFESVVGVPAMLVGMQHVY